MIEFNNKSDMMTLLRHDHILLNSQKILLFVHLLFENHIIILKEFEILPNLIVAKGRGFVFFVIILTFTIEVEPTPYQTTWSCRSAGTAGTGFNFVGQ